MFQHVPNHQPDKPLNVRSTQVLRINWSETTSVFWWFLGSLHVPLNPELLQHPCCKKNAENRPSKWIKSISGWWFLADPSEKYVSIGMMKLQIYGKIKNVPNHQPDFVKPKTESTDKNTAICVPRGKDENWTCRILKHRARMLQWPARWSSRSQRCRI